MALGASVRNLVTEDTDTAKAAISYLKRKNGGRVTFLPLTTITVRQPRAIDLVRYRGVVGWANTLVQADGKFQKVADHLLAQTLVMETLDEALIAAKQEGYRLRIVTLTGELLNPGGSLSGGGRRKQQSTLLNRRAEIDTLLSRLRAHEDTHKEMHAALEQHRLHFKETDERYTEKRAEAERLVQELITERAKCDVLQERIADQTETIHAMECAEEARLAHGVELAQKRTRLEHHISQCKAHEARFTQEIAQLTAQCEGLRTDGREHEERLHELDIALAALSTEIETRARHRASREFERAEAEKALKDIVEQSAQLTNGLQKDEVRLSELERKIDRQNASFQEREHQSAVLKDQRLAHEAESRVLDAAIKSVIARVENIRTKQHDCDKALERIHIRLEDCRATLLSDFGVTPEMAAADAQDADPHFLKERLQALEHAIQELGSINPNAVEEYAEKKARYEEEEAQIEDLRDAKQDIEQIIKKIDQDMTRTFRDAFHQIQEYFNEIFVRLFGGASDGQRGYTEQWC